MHDLFQSGSYENQSHSLRKSLAELLRPKTLQDVIGQEKLIGEDGTLSRSIENFNKGRSSVLKNIIFWGPSGTGKTTVARLVAGMVLARFIPINAMDVTSAILRPIFAEAKYFAGQGKTTIVFIDEIHRLSRSQQDAFLPVLEDGSLVCFGATTENPSFVLSSAFLSRSQVMIFEPLSVNALSKMLERAECILKKTLPVEDNVRKKIYNMADGDGRYFLGMVESIWAAQTSGEIFDLSQVEKIIHKRLPKYDKNQDGHYNLISALQKSIRASDPDAALYYFARMLDAGEDPRYIARRLVRTAAEDIGLAAPAILQHAIAAQQAFVLLGSPEGELALANLVVRLATAPKSNAVYVAYKKARILAKETGSLVPPLNLLNAPTKLMHELGYGRAYNYDHDAPHAFSGQNCWPEGMIPHILYEPTDRGAEAEIGERLKEFREYRERKL